MEKNNTSKFRIIGKDLNYEGIETLILSVNFSSSFLSIGKDLNYEGIETKNTYGTSRPL